MVWQIVWSKNKEGDWVVVIMLWVVYMTLSQGMQPEEAMVGRLVWTVGEEVAT